MAEAKCWTCARAYARPDPQGCVYIRSGGQIHVEGSEIKYLKPENFGNNRRQMVVCCPNYDRSNRTPEREMEEPEEVKVINKEARVCNFCGKAIPLDKNRRTMYCDRTCWERMRTKKRTEEREENRPPKPCALCGEIYQPNKITSKYCNKPECRKTRDDMYKTTYKQQLKKPAQRGPGEAIEGSRETL